MGVLRLPGRILLLRLSTGLLGLASLAFGIVSLIFPEAALRAAGLSDIRDRELFEAALMGSALIPLGAGYLAAARAANLSRLWVSLGIFNSVAALVVLVFFWGRGTVEIARIWPAIAVYGVALLGMTAFGQQELRARQEPVVTPVEIPAEEYREGT